MSDRKIFIDCDALGTDWMETECSVFDTPYYSQAVIDEKDALLREAEGVIRELRDANDADGRSITYVPVLDLIRANLGDEA